MIRKTVIIIGASGGIGGKTAIEFARKGYNVAMTFFAHNVNKLENEIKKFGVETLSLKMDIRDEDEVKKVFKIFFDHFDMIEAVINLSGVADKERLLIDVNEKTILNLIDVNLKGSILISKEACKYFISKKRGCIINTSSILGKEGCSGEVIYSATKAGIIGLTKALSKEVGPLGIRVNCIAPGMIDTKMVKDFTESDRKSLAENTSLRRIGQSEDIAFVIRFLASDDAKFITGECIEISGGLLI